MRLAALALACACLPDPHGLCAGDADCAGGAAGSFCAEGICQGPPRGALESLPQRAFARGETLHVRARVAHAHGDATGRVVFGGAAIPAVREVDGALGADVPLQLAPAGVEGAVPFSVELRDDLGHVTALPGSVKVDDRPPRVSVDAASVPVEAVVRGTQVSVRVVVEDLTAVTVAGATRNSDGSFALVVDTRKAPADAAVFEVVISAVDEAGNVGTGTVGVGVTRVKFAVSHPGGRPITSLVLTETMIWSLADHGEFWLLRRSDGATLSRPLTGGTALPEFATDGTRLFFARSDDQVCRMGADGVIQVCCGPYSTLTSGPILQGSTAIIATTGTLASAMRLYAINDTGSSCGNIVGTPKFADFANTAPGIAPDGAAYAGAVQAVATARFDGIGWDQRATSETPHYRGAPAFRGKQVLLSTGAAGALDTFTFLDSLGNPAPTPTSTQVAAAGVTLSSPTIAADGTAVLTTDDRLAIALRPDNTIRWTAPLPGVATAPPTHGAGDVVYIGTLSGHVLALRLNDGSTLWSYAAGAPVRGPLAPGCDGLLYAATDGAVLALVTDAAGLADSAWPRAAHDVRGTGDARRPLRSPSGGCLE